jgi:hypothetical protein
MHDISQKQFAPKTFTVFKELCGNDAARNVILLTTKWSNIKSSSGKERERQLSQVYWKDMLEHGSRMHRFEDSYNSAWDIVASIVENVPLDVIQIQRELVDLGKLLPETEAGKVLRGDLEEVLEEQMKKARALRKEQTPESIAAYQKSVDRMRPIANQIQEFKIPLGRRIMRILGLTKRDAD